jgi:hypothetical protein
MVNNGVDTNSSQFAVLFARSLTPDVERVAFPPMGSPHSSLPWCMFRFKERIGRAADFFFVVSLSCQSGMA